MSLPPTNGRVWPLASVLTITLGTPNGKARIAAVPITVPAEPPRPRMPSTSPRAAQVGRRSRRRPAAAVGHRLAPVAPRADGLGRGPRAAEDLVAVDVGRERRRAERAGVDDQGLEALARGARRGRRRVSSPLVSSVPTRTTGIGGSRPSAARAVDGGRAAPIIMAARRSPRPHRNESRSDRIGNTLATGSADGTEDVPMTAIDRSDRGPGHRRGAGDRPGDRPGPGRAGPQGRADRRQRRRRRPVGRRRSPARAARRSACRSTSPTPADWDARRGRGRRPLGAARRAGQQRRDQPAGDGRVDRRGPLGPDPRRQPQRPLARDQGRLALARRGRGGRSSTSARPARPGRCRASSPTSRARPASGA